MNVHTLDTQQIEQDCKRRREGARMRGGKEGERGEVAREGENEGGSKGGSEGARE